MPHLIRRGLLGALPVAACILTAAPVGAQKSWTVTVNPTMNPLPIGVCAEIRIAALDPGTRDVPRNPRGAYVTIADFDMSVTAPDANSVAGQQIDAYHWSACSCQGAKVGTVATVTATYPARLLATELRVSDVAFQIRATFTIGPPAGTFNPRACTAKSAVAVAPQPTATPTAVSSPAAAVATPAPTAPIPVAAPSSPPGPRTPGPAAAPVQPPVNIRVAGTPAEAVVTWDGPTSGNPGPASYVVERWKTSDPACCRATSPALPHKYSNRWTDPLMGTGSWTYQVSAIYPDGRRGSALGSYNYPEPETPKGLKALQVARNTVLLTWQPVDGASYYVVAGPPSNIAIRVDTTSLTQTGVPVGGTTWKVAAMYTGQAAGSPQAGSPFATTSLLVVNPHYRLVAEAIRVTRETVDKPLSEDGMFDEIYLSSIAEKYNRNGMTLDTRDPVRLSHVHGDVSFWYPSERVQAGTASASGGIKAFDIVTPIWSAPAPSQLMGAPPFVLWDGELIPGKHDLMLHPVIWELDQPTSHKARELGGPCINRLCSWAKFLSGGLGNSSPYGPPVMAAIAGTQLAVVDGVNVWLGTTGDGGGMVHMERHDQDRPIGLAVNTTDPNPDGLGLVGNWIDKVVILSSEKIEAALAAGNHTIDVRFWDHWNLPNTPHTSVNHLNGDYTLVIRIQRMP
jgi:hypothetical protein